MTPYSLHLAPEELDGNQDDLKFIHDVSSRMGTDSSIYRVVSTSGERQQVFIASSPEQALLWICQRVQKRTLMHVVQRVYTEEIPDCNDDEDHEDDSSDNGNTNRRKRKRKTGVTRTHNARKKVMTEGEGARLSAEEQRYRLFMSNLPKVGIEVARDMISKAAAIATRDCLLDWRAVLKVWRTRPKEALPSLVKSLSHFNMSQEGLFMSAHGSTQLQTQLDFSQTQLESSQPPLDLSQTQPNTCFSRLEAKGFKSLFLAAHTNHAVGILGDMKHRWIMAAMYNEYEALEGRLRKHAAPLRGRGRGFATVAREQLFAAVYSESDRSPATRDHCPAQWKEFGHWLDYGKRWFMLYQRFGVGIFALLPRSMITNTYVERSLPMSRFTEWVDMIAECNQDIFARCNEIKDLYISCMTDDSPPAPLCLEQMSDLELQNCNLKLALAPWDDLSHNVEEVSDEDVSSSLISASFIND